MSLKKNSIFFIMLLFAQIAFAQFTIPSKPKLQTSVYDYANLLSPAKKQSLKNKLIKYADSTSTQIVIVTVETIKGEDIGILTPKWAHQWGVGQAKEDNGVFILLANKEHKIWISPGYGVEHKLTAGITGSIVRNVIIPQFKKGNFYAGLDKGVDAIFEVLIGVYKNKPSQKKENFIYFLGLIVIGVIFVFLIIAISKNNKGGGYRKRSVAEDILTTIILSGSGRGNFENGGSFGSGSSGSFGGGFGGGGFSGGGAGGSW